MLKSGPGAGRRFRALVYTIVTTGTVLLFALAEWATKNLLSGYGRTSTAVEVGIVLIFALIVRPVHRTVEEAIEAAFYRRRRQAVAALEKLRPELTTYGDMNELLRCVMEAVEHHAEARACAVYLHRDLFRPEATSFENAAEEIGEDDPLIRRFHAAATPAHPGELTSAAPGTHAFPMNAAGELVGFLTVESKHGVYDAEEMAALSGLAKDLAIAVAAIDPVVRLSKNRVPNNLPALRPALIGREREIEEIRALLARPDIRVVSLTGPGGVGKTSVALSVASSEMAHHEQGVWFVDFAPLQSGDLVDATLLSAIGGGSVQQGSERTQLLGYLTERDLVLVLDNCEHVVADVARTVDEIVGHCPRVKLLATSREMLHVTGEHVYRLDPLDPDAARRLFSARAASVSADFDPDAHAEQIAAICSHLDGVPLAIELAAARARVLAPAEILERLAERFRLLTSGNQSLPRHQTLSATIAWSYDLLSEPERSLFMRLATFRGSFSLAAATAIAQDGNDEYLALDLLTSLADKSLLTVVPGESTRYRLLETIRAFAAERALEMQATAIARRQHALYFVDVAALAYHQFDTKLPAGWLEGLVPDIDNFRAALEWTLEGAGDRAIGVQLVADCGPMFLRMGLLTEGLQWCESARKVPGLSDASAGRIEYVASMLHNNLIEAAQALVCAERALTHLLKTDDRRGIVRALSQVAQLYARAQRLDEAEEAASSAIAMARELGEPRILSTVLRRCAFSLRRSSIAESRVLFEEALSVSRSANEPDELCYVLTWYSQLEADVECYDLAMALAEQALAVADDNGRQYLRLNLAKWAILNGSPESAYPHAVEALRLALEAKNQIMTAFAIAFAAPKHAQIDAAEAAHLLGYATACLNQIRFRQDDDDILAFKRASHLVEQALNGAPIDPLLGEGAKFDMSQIREMLRPILARQEARFTTGVARDGVGALLR